MPRLQINGERAIATTATLINIARRVIEHTKHRYKTIAQAIRATDKRAAGANIVRVETNSTRVLTDDGAVSEGLIDAGDAVVLHGEEEA